MYGDDIPPPPPPPLVPYAGVFIKPGTQPRLNHFILLLSFIESSVFLLRYLLYKPDYIYTYRKFYTKSQLMKTVLQNFFNRIFNNVFNIACVKSAFLSNYDDKIKTQTMLFSQ